MADGDLGNAGVFPSLSSEPPSFSSSEDPLSLGEEDPEFVHDADRQRFLCPVHRGVLRNSRQTTCGHRICQECVGLHLNGAASKMCPLAMEDCEQVTATNTNPDKSIQREMKVAPVYCKNKQEGCSITVLLKNYKKHLQDCEYRSVACPYSLRGCREKPLQGQVKEHQHQCPFRPERCQLCQTEVSHNYMKDHNDNDCGEKVTGCPFGCDDKSLKRKQVLGHRDVCSMKPVECKLKPMGCPFVAQKEEVEKHEREAVAEHLELACSIVDKVQKDAEARQQALVAERQEMLHSLQLLEEQRGKTVGKMRDVEMQTKDLKLKLVTAMEKVITVERKLTEMVQQTRVEAMEQNLVAIQQRVAQLEQQTESGQTQQSSSVGTGSDMQVVRFGTINNMAETVHTQLSTHTQQIQIHNVRMAEMDLRFQLLETASYDGVLIWKIRDYAQRKRDAVSSRTLLLYSQPFYSHRFGYKMCSRVYLNGDGQGKSTHLSLFFAIMRGSYDALLKWPFRQKVTMTLLDQSAQQNHLSDHFVPDVHSSSFQKPVTEMNTATGCPLFVSHTNLEDPSKSFLKADTIFVRITVDPNPYPYLF